MVRSEACGEFYRDGGLSISFVFDRQSNKTGRAKRIDDCVPYRGPRDGENFPRYVQHILIQFRTTSIGRLSDCNSAF